MARTAKLQVYRTAIGFHDAYVAAPSQKAALAAWGSDKNLFARGAAEIVSDPTLIKEPLASPGEVIKRLRGTADEQMAALPADKPRSVAPKAARSSAAKLKPKPPTPPPSRATLDKAEAALEEMLDQARDELADLERREAALAKERKRLLSDQEAAKGQLTGRRDQAAADYDRAIRQWRGH